MRLLGNLFSNNNQFIPKVFGCIDVNNLLASGIDEYIATQDCFAYADLKGTSFGLYIDEVALIPYNADDYYIFPIKKGQKVRTTGNQHRLKIYGIKY